MSASFEQRLEMASYAFTCYFALEATIKLCLYGRGNFEGGRAPRADQRANGLNCHAHDFTYPTPSRHLVLPIYALILSFCNPSFCNACLLPKLFRNSSHPPTHTPSRLTIDDPPAALRQRSLRMARVLESPG